MTLRQWGLRAAVGVVGLALALLVGAFAYLSYERAAVARAIAIDGAVGIDTLEAPIINGARQWVQIRGKDRSNPVLLFIHGGPGMPMMPWAHMFQPAWEDAFTVAQWDQRGAGKTSAVAEASGPIADGAVIDTFVTDASEVARYVAAKTGAKRIGVVAHSWGSAVGLRLVQRHPELFFAYVGTGQITDAPTQERVGFEFALNHAKQSRNQQAIEELQALMPYPQSLHRIDSRTHMDEWMRVSSTQRKWVSVYGGSIQRKDVLEEFTFQQFLSPAYSYADLYRLSTRTLETVIGGARSIMEEMSRVTLASEGSVFQLPVFFFEGRQDYVTPAVVVAQRLESIQAPHKELVWFERSAHFPMVEEPTRFRDMLVERVRPFAFERSEQE